MNIYNRKNEVRRKIFSKMLKKRQQKSSTRLCNGVLVRKWMQNKSHHHVHEFRTFSKRSTWCKQTLLDTSEEERYRTINPVHVGVELLDKYERTCDREVT